MLTGVLSDEAGHPMYRIDRRGFVYYACRQRCGFSVPLARADAEVTSEVIDTYGELPHMVRRLIPGKNQSLTFLRQETIADSESRSASDLNVAPEPSNHEKLAVRCGWLLVDVHTEFNADAEEDLPEVSDEQRGCVVRGAANLSITGGHHRRSGASHPARRSAC
jgi:hypothetical protein